MKCFTASQVAKNICCSPRRQNVPSTPCPIPGNHWPWDEVGRKNSAMIQTYPNISKMSPLKILQDHTTNLHDSLSAAWFDPSLSLCLILFNSLNMVEHVWMAFQNDHVIPKTFGFRLQGTQPYSWWSWRTGKLKDGLDNLSMSSKLCRNRGSLVELKQPKQSNQLQISLHSGMVPLLIRIVHAHAQPFLHHSRSQEAPQERNAWAQKHPEAKRCGKESNSKLIWPWPYPKRIKAHVCHYQNATRYYYNLLYR